MEGDVSEGPHMGVLLVKKRLVVVGAFLGGVLIGLYLAPMIDEDERRGEWGEPEESYRRVGWVHDSTVRMSGWDGVPVHQHPESKITEDHRALYEMVGGSHD